MLLFSSQCDIQIVRLEKKVQKWIITDRKHKTPDEV